MYKILTIDEFKTCKRDLLLDYDVYKDVAEDLSMRIPRVTRNMANVDWMADKDAGQVIKGVAIFAKDCFGHPSPSNRQKLNATT